MYPRNEILFPHRSVSALKDLRDSKWRQLVERIAALPETHVDALAFSLMRIRLCECLNCDLGSYKASLGCPTCARRAVMSVKGSDAILLRRFKKAKKDIVEYLNSIGAEIEKAA